METKENRFLDFNSARLYVISLNLKSKVEWKRYVKHKPKNIPSAPETVYKNSWISWNDWLGNNNKFCGYKKILKYNDALNISTKLNIKNKKDWEDYLYKTKRNDIPRRPDLYYDEWVSWSEWLGTNSKSDRDFLNIEKLKEILNVNKIVNKTKFLDFYSKNKNLKIPSNPIKYYNLESWKSLFNSNCLYLNYIDALKIVNGYNLKGQKYWYIMCKENLIPKNIPKTPNKFYKEWTSWNDWLGHNITTHKKFLSYENAKNFIKNLNFSSLQEYYDYLILNKIDFLPLNPIIYYKNEYENSDIFLSGSDNISYGEKKIKEYLNTNGFKYEQQKKFEKCINKKNLLFDFYLSDINLCIEFDGKQHFKSIKYFGGEEGFIQRKKNDIIKNNFCYENKIKLLRISYEDINIIDKILDNELKFSDPLTT